MNRDNTVLFYVGLGFLVLAACIFLFGCSPSVAQQTSQESRLVSEAPAIPIKTPTVVKQEAPSLILDQWQVFTLMLAVCHDNQSDEATVISKCFAEVMTNWLKLPDEKKVNAGEVVQLAQAFFSEVAP